MKYIDIPLINIFEKETIFFSEAINKFGNIVLLGTPGSGKSSLLTKYSEENKDKTLKKTVKEFVKFDIKIDENIEILLLDGLDEYRSFEKDKNSVIFELANKLKNINCKKVISCRELDWYGDNDNQALKDNLNEDFEILRISSLNEELQNNMIKIIDSSLNSKEIIKKFSFSGLLQNPQLLKMAVETYNKNQDSIETKKDLFETFIKIAGKEHNPNYSSIDINYQDIFKYNGYIAFFYMFSDVKVFNDEFFSEISNENFKIEGLKESIKSKLYSQYSNFIHRTIAEYLCAKFIVEYKLNTQNILFKDRIKAIFVTKKKIFSELRGVYSWIGVLNQDIDWISIDPFYQLIYADNSFFNSNFKKEIIQSIKIYAEKVPYFFTSYIDIFLRGFYVKELDDFLMEEFTSTTKLNNHYLLLISHIIKDAQSISIKLREFIDEKIIDNEISPYIKENLIVHLNTKEKKDVLQKILDDTIKDNEYNTLKEKLLKDLYPKYLSIEKLIDVLKKYEKSNMMFQCYYLFDTKFEDKYDLVDALYKNFEEITNIGRTIDFEKIEPVYSIENFIKDYFVEVYLSYQEKSDTKSIYDILNHFHSYYRRYDKLKCEAYTKNTKDKLELSKDLLEDLANELFRIYVKEKINEEELLFFDFNNIFSLIKPSDKSNIFLENMDMKHSNDINKNLFYNAMLSYKDKNLNEKFEYISKKYHLEEELNKYKNPTKSEWEIEAEIEAERSNEEFEENRKRNNAYFKSKSDDEILDNFNDLKWAFTYLNHLKGLIDNETKIRLETIFKQLLEKYLYKDEANLNTLMLSMGSKNREIDLIYYEALIINYEDIDFDKLDNDLKKYLYILYVDKQNVANIKKPEEFIKYAENSFAKEVLKYTLTKLLDDVRLTQCIQQIDDIKLLKNLLYFYNQDNIQIKIVDNLIENIHFKILKDDLNYIYETYKIKEANSILMVKNGNLLNQNDIIDLYVKIFRFDRGNKFNELDSNDKINFVYNFVLIFNDREMLKQNSGIQTNYDQFVHFINYQVFNLLKIKDLDILLGKIEKTSIWYDNILTKINTESQSNANSFNRYKINSLKEFINKNEILDYSDFFEDIFLRLKTVKTTIEDNRDNQQKLFFVNSEPKKENECRDIVVQKLKDKYDDISVSREQTEADNRADINIKYKYANFEIQIECKKDNNRELYKGIKEQLIDKYLSKNVNYGIYLIFNFGDKKEEELIAKLKENIPNENKDRIKIISFSLKNNVKNKIEKS